MSKTKMVTIKMNPSTAAAVRQVLFDSQRGYTNNIDTMPTRIFEIREVIADLDDAIGQVSE